MLHRFADDMLVIWGEILRGDRMSLVSRRQFVQMMGLAGALVLAGGCASESPDGEGVGIGDVVSADEASSIDRTYRAFGSIRTLEEIRDSGTFVVGVCSDARPYGYINGSGNYVGLDVAFADAIGWDMGVEVRYVETDPVDVVPYLSANKVDAVLCSTALPVGVSTATPFVALRQAIVARASSTLASMDDLSGSEVGVCSGTAAEEFLTKAAPDVSVCSFSSYTGAYQAMRDGAVVALCLDQLVARSWAKTNPAFSVLLDNLGEPCPIGAMVAMGNEDLLAVINHETFSLVNDGRIKSAFNKYVVPDLSGVDYTGVLLPVQEE
ncbi:MAG: transporter substrate-binding domain-containing protein [Atopobiaceae bacterium]|nr:transporter substrate-binding domain-containing protein [Atopobiaceae bacterium]